MFENRFSSMLCESPPPKRISGCYTARLIANRCCISMAIRIHTPSNRLIQTMIIFIFSNNNRFRKRAMRMINHRRLQPTRTRFMTIQELTKEVKR
ncbi:hypothetical protein HanXRQr2_Chr02g0081851 [Helianthus annuus]|uniref:Uncharacterized protein n=1 Tax=Helianthus annuus TaxID=4232 RepID=A0A9K3P1F8_HELAN|nr:hypothetical protein HanXRQr2_Chr02g0081851 [Helianthus annuus]